MDIIGIALKSIGLPWKWKDLCFQVGIGKGVGIAVQTHTGASGLRLAGGSGRQLGEIVSIGLLEEAKIEFGDDGKQMVEDIGLNTLILGPTPVRREYIEFLW